MDKYMLSYSYDQMIKADDDSWIIYEELFKNYVDNCYTGYDKNKIKKEILNNKLKWLAKQLFFFEAVKEIIELFCQIEIGSECEIDYENIAGYLLSKKFYYDFWSINEKEEIYKIVTDDILNGLPVWKFIKMSDNRRQIIESNLKEQEEKEKNQYLCYSCEYNYSYEPVTKYEYEMYTGFSNINRCYKTNNMENTLKDNCKYYKKKS